MGQTAHPGQRVRRWLSLAVAAVAVGAGLTGCGRSVASAATVLERVDGASVMHADGHSEPAHEGQRLQAGDVVRTTAAGSVQLVTLGRRVWLGGAGVIAVQDGANQQLRHGAVLIDAQGGPGLSMTAGDLQVAAPADSVVRVERGFAQRVGVLAGGAQVTNSAGRSLAIPALHQVWATGLALPAGVTPLQLVDDPAELDTGLPVVLDDVLLGRLARGLDVAADGRVVAADSATYLRAADFSLPAGSRPSESVLPLAIARAASGPPLVHRYAEALGLRSAGGSWGVVAHLLGTSATATGSALGSIEQALLGGSGRTVGSVLAAPSTGSGGTGGGLAGPTPTPLSSGIGSTGGSGSGTVGTTGQPAGSGGGTNSSPKPSPSPTNSTASLIGTLTKALPSPAPTPSTAAPPILP